VSDGNGNPTDKYIIVATTRPETIMADAAVCINPDDERYHWLKGQKVLIPLINKEIPIIEDSYVAMDFGTGCLKVTPAHDVNDYEIGNRHNLPVLDIIDDHGRLNEKAQILVNDASFFKVENFTPKHTEGQVKTVDVEYKLSEWLGDFDHALRSSMSYAGAKRLDQFIGKVNWETMTPVTYNAYMK
jgi:valyl-tRNA synthetase